MRMYRAFVKGARGHWNETRIHAESAYSASQLLEAQYGIGNVRGVTSV